MTLMQAHFSFNRCHNGIRPIHYPIHYYTGSNSQSSGFEDFFKSFKSHSVVKPFIAQISVPPRHKITGESVHPINMTKSDLKLRQNPNVTN